MHSFCVESRVGLVTEPKASGPGLLGEGTDGWIGLGSQDSGHDFFQTLERKGRFFWFRLRSPSSCHSKLRIGIGFYQSCRNGAEVGIQMETELVLQFKEF
jgi:hypothetical protein